jgi:hypothetical protein
MERPPISARTELEELTVIFQFAGLEIAVRTRSRELSARVAKELGLSGSSRPRNVIAELKVSGSCPLILELDGQAVAEAEDEPAMVRAVKQKIARILCAARPRHTWLAGSAFSRAERALVVAGNLGAEAAPWAESLCAAGWDLLGDDWIPILHPSLEVLPFGGAARSEATKLGALVVASHRLTAVDSVRRISPSVAVAGLIPVSLDFQHDRKKAVERLCELVVEVPVLQASFSSGDRGAALIGEAEEMI